MTTFEVVRKAILETFGWKSEEMIVLETPLSEELNSRGGMTGAINLLEILKRIEEELKTDGLIFDPTLSSPEITSLNIKKIETVGDLVKEVERVIGGSKK